MYTFSDNLSLPQLPNQGTLTRPARTDLLGTKDRRGGHSAQLYRCCTDEWIACPTGQSRPSRILQVAESAKSSFLVVRIPAGEPLVQLRTQATAAPTASAERRLAGNDRRVRSRVQVDLLDRERPRSGQPESERQLIGQMLAGGCLRDQVLARIAHRGRRGPDPGANRPPPAG